MRGDVGAEVAPDAVLRQVLLDVRQVERRHGRAVILQVLADGAQRLRPGEIADERHEQVLLLEILQELEVLFVGQIAADRRRRRRSPPSGRRSSTMLPPPPPPLVDEL